MKVRREGYNGAIHLPGVSTPRHANLKPPPLPSSYSFGRSWAHDQNNPARKPHWQIVPRLVIWDVIAAITLPLLLRCRRGAHFFATSTDKNQTSYARQGRTDIANGKTAEDVRLRGSIKLSPGFIRTRRLPASPHGHTLTPGFIVDL